MEKIVLIASREYRYQYRDFLNELQKEYELVRPTGFGQQGIHLALGGDEVLNELKNLGSPDLGQDQRKIVYFPCGRDIDFARSLGFSAQAPSYERFCAVMEKGRHVDIPVMQCNGHRFLNMAQVGSLAAWKNDRRAWRQVLNKTHPSYRITFDLDGHETRSFETMGFVVAQGLYALGGMRLSTASSPLWYDNFEFLSIRGSLRRQVLRSFLQLQKNICELPHDLVSLKAHWLTITADTPMPVQLDGEYFSATRFNFSRDGGKLRFLLH